MITLATDNGVAVRPVFRRDISISELRDDIQSYALRDLPNRRAMAKLASDIAVKPARSIEDIRAKAAAVKLIHFGDGYFEPLDFDTPIGRLFVSLLHDLEAFVAVRDVI